MPSEQVWHKKSETISTHINDFHAMKNLSLPLLLKNIVIICYLILYLGSFDHVACEKKEITFYLCCDVHYIYYSFLVYVIIV